MVHGNQLEQNYCFPTANIPMKRLVAPVAGVYAVDVYLADHQSPLAGWLILAVVLP